MVLGYLETAVVAAAGIQDFAGLPVVVVVVFVESDGLVAGFVPGSADSVVPVAASAGPVVASAEPVAASADPVAVAASADAAAVSADPVAAFVDPAAGSEMLVAAAAVVFGQVI